MRGWYRGEARGVQGDVVIRQVGGMRQGGGGSERPLNIGMVGRKGKC